MFFFLTEGRHAFLMHAVGSCKAKQRVGMRYVFIRVAADKMVKFHSGTLQCRLLDTLEAENG